MISTQVPRALFLNPPKSNCSIYESGAMIFAALRRSRMQDVRRTSQETARTVLRASRRARASARDNVLCRPQGLTDILKSGLTWSDYPLEPLPYDGTILHAIERLLPTVCEQTGYSGRRFMLRDVKGRPGRRRRTGR